MILNPEKRKVDSSILSLTTIWKASQQPSHLRKAQKEREPCGARSARAGQDPHRKPTTAPSRGNPARCKDAVGPDVTPPRHAERNRTRGYTQ